MGKRTGLRVSPGEVGADECGDFEGPPVGIELGLLVVGRKVGWPEGWLVGRADGCRVGWPLGWPLGCIVGEPEGCEDGCIDGQLLGCTVGWQLGTRDGCPVGLVGCEVG